MVKINRYKGNHTKLINCISVILIELARTDCIGTYQLENNVPFLPTKEQYPHDQGHDCA